MENTQDQPFKILREQVTEYVDLRIEQARLGLIEKSAKVTARSASAIIIISLLLLLKFSLILALAFFLGQWLHSYGMGFLASAGIYLVLLLIYLAIVRKKVELSIMNTIIKLTNQEDEQE